MFKIQIFKITDHRLRSDTEIVYEGNGNNHQEKIRNLYQYYNSDYLTEKIIVLFKPYIQSHTSCEIYIKLLDLYVQDMGSWLQKKEPHFKKLIFSYNSYIIDTFEDNKIEKLLIDGIIESIEVLDKYIKNLFHGKSRDKNGCIVC